MLTTRHSSPRWELLWWTQIAAHLSGWLASLKAANKLSQHLTLQGSLQPFLPCAMLGAFWGLRGCVHQRVIVSVQGKTVAVPGGMSRMICASAG